MPARTARRPAPPANLAVRTQAAVVSALAALGPKGLRAVEEAVAASSRRDELTYIREVGRPEVIRLLTAPVVFARRDIDYLRRLCELLFGAFRKVAEARARDAELKDVLPLEPEEEEWFALSPPVGRAPLVSRWDMNLDPAVGARGARLFELNGCAIGGLHYAPTSSAIVLEHAGGLAPRPLALPASMGTLWWMQVSAHARACGRAGRRVAWLEDRSWETGITEGPSLVARLVSEGESAVVADPRDLELAGGEVTYHGLALDVLYRSIELRDLTAIEKEHGPLRAMREAVRRGLVLSPLEADLDHKSLLEVFTSARYARLFTAAERAAFRRHVPWTRLLAERKTDGPDGRPVDLPSFARKQRARLVVKPNRSCGGEGILIGRDTRAAAWERAIARALDGREPAVVQALVDSATTPSPTIRRGRVAVERHYTTYGIYVTPDGVGILGRAAPFPVVNVSRGGGLLGVLLV